MNFLFAGNKKKLVKQAEFYFPACLTKSSNPGPSHTQSLGPKPGPILKLVIPVMFTTKILGFGIKGLFIPELGILIHKDNRIKLIDGFESEEVEGMIA
jgi:hypothetical protein